MIEKVVAKQLADYINDNNLSEVFQFAYRSNHSTETALIRVYNDIAFSINNRGSVILVLLDLSAVFDTVDHRLLCSRLSIRFGISDMALDWIYSYLSDRTHFVKVNDGISGAQNLDYGVPQGSVLGLMLYSLYTTPLGDIARSHGLPYHFYADDSQLYVSFKTSSFEDMVSCKSKIEACVTDIDPWMIMNKLKMNGEKTEILVFSWCYRLRPPLDFLDIVSENVLCSTIARNIAVPRFNLKTYGGRSFTVAAPTIWNSLALELRSRVYVSTFKSKLKTSLFKEAFR